MEGTEHVQSCVAVEYEECAYFAYTHHPRCSASLLLQLRDAPLSKPKERCIGRISSTSDAGAAHSWRHPTSIHDRLVSLQHP